MVDAAAPGAVDPAFAHQAREEWGLTPRETEVAWLTAQGVTRGGDIARRLGIGPETVKSYRASIRRKTALAPREPHEPCADYRATLLAMRARGVYERMARAVALAALADDFAALERLTRGVMTYLDREDT